MDTNKLTGYPLIDKPWLKYYSEEPRDIPRDDTTFFDCLYEKNIEHPNDIALVYYGKKFTYGELFSNIQRTRDALLNYGIKSGDKGSSLLHLPPKPYILFLRFVGLVLWQI